MKKVLIVDDANFVRMRYAKSLQARGFATEEAANGVEALARYKEGRPDGVLLDINMPVMNGLITLHEIMNLDPTARVAMVTCVGSESIILNALKSGARDFVTKPMDDSGLLNTVGKLLS